MSNGYCGRRGRPLGFKLSEASKRSISMSKVGQRHRSETKDKISKSLVMYFKKRNPISDEINNRYIRVCDIASYCWFEDNRDELDLSMDILTEKAMRNKNKIELSCGSNIEYFSHNITPELIYLFKEFCEENGLDYEDVLLEI